MGHCVANYGDTCSADQTRIYRIERDREHLGASEIWIPAQARGRRNCDLPEGGVGAPGRLTERYTRSWQDRRSEGSPPPSLSRYAPPSTENAAGHPAADANAETRTCPGSRYLETRGFREYRESAWERTIYVSKTRAVLRARRDRLVLHNRRRRTHRLGEVPVPSVCEKRLPGARRGWVSAIHRIRTLAWQAAWAECEAERFPPVAACEAAGDGWLIDPDAKLEDVAFACVCRKHTEELIETGAAARLRLAFSRGQGNDLTRWPQMTSEIPGPGTRRSLSKNMNRFIPYHRRHEENPGTYGKTDLIGHPGALWLLDPALRYTDAEKMRLAAPIRAQNESGLKALALLVETDNAEGCAHPDGNEIHIDEATCKRDVCSPDMLWRYYTDLFEVERRAQADRTG